MLLEDVTLRAELPKLRKKVDMCMCSSVSEMISVNTTAVHFDSYRMAGPVRWHYLLL
jgi:hypothetical protein